MLGQRINNYEIIEEIGSGGMGTVYLARHPFIKRKAAIKVLRKEFVSSAEVATRFLNEALAANAIGHPNIIDIIDAGRLPQSGTPYLMMEFLDGESLAQRIRHVGRIPIAEALAYACQIASALGAAHTKGIVHRDLKPENLFLVADPRNPGRELVKVLDFGIAKLQGATMNQGVQTQTGMVMGTPSYMSPEQCRGTTQEIDHRTDIYALGIIIYEMVCGSPPFEAQGLGEIIAMHLTRQVIPPRDQNLAVSKYLEREILRALSKRPQDRHASMEDLYFALRAPEATVDSNLTPPVAGAPIPAVDQMATSKESLGGTTTFSSVTGELGSVTPEAKRRPSAFVVTGIGLAIVGAVVVFALVVGKNGPPPHSGTATSGAASPSRAAPIPNAAASIMPAHPLAGVPLQPAPAAVAPVHPGKPFELTPRSAPDATHKPQPSSPPAHVPATSAAEAAGLRESAPTASSSPDGRAAKKAGDLRRPRVRPKPPVTNDDTPIKF
jgi:serine/threonine protein kinase